MESTGHSARISTENAGNDANPMMHKEENRPQNRAPRPVDAVFVGIDVGTTGVRACAVSNDGEVLAEGAAPIPSQQQSSSAKHTHEQEPRAWWKAVCEACGRLLENLDRTRIKREQIRTVCVDGTSGTLVCLDRNGEPCRAAIMYNDRRGALQAETLNALAADYCRTLGYRFAPSFALVKALWLQENEPECFEQTARFAHQADFVVERLTDRPAVTDYSNALKTGYDILTEKWPEWMGQLSGIRERLPQVVAPGAPVGVISTAAARETGLPPKTRGVAGATDGVAACMASGANRPGDVNVTLGTTLVFKAITTQICTHPEGLIYSHKLPENLWLPGAASNTGAEWTTALFPNQDYRDLDRLAADRLPSPSIAYPLVRAGERFPFRSDQAEQFFLPEPRDLLDKYAACLQGVALLERLAYEVIESVAGESSESVFSTGTACSSDVWMQLRANATGKSYHRPEHADSAFGSAIFAAAEYFGGLAAAARRLVRIERVFHPDPAVRGFYERLYATYCDELRKRGYL